MIIDSPYLVTPGKGFRLKDVPTGDQGRFKDKEAAAAPTAKNLEALDELQERLYAEAKRALLVIFQAMDCGGKDGAIEHVFSGVNPQGCIVASFKAPSSRELSQDFLWRIHAAVPPRGMIGIFNRSHYESVLVERVRELVPKKVWEKRYDHINHFEQMLVDEGMTILKFFLHISKDEQKRRLQARLDDPTKHWKFNVADLKERQYWEDYQSAYQDALSRCSTRYAPWYVVPANRKWYRNWVISDTIVRAMKKMNPQYPEPQAGLEKVVVK
jgi:PPK2 family polyphosphate:nucleotide phosphotransferase